MCPTNVTDLDLMTLGDSLKHEFSIRGQGGTAHLLVYWFEMDYGGTKVVTYHSDQATEKGWHFKQSMITFKEPVIVRDELKVTFLYQSGLHN